MAQPTADRFAIDLNWRCRKASAVEGWPRPNAVHAISEPCPHVITDTLVQRQRLTQEPDERRYCLHAPQPHS
jgi:hypothetical protein